MPNDKILLDNNILMFLYNPVASRDDKKYSDAVDRLEDRNCQLLVNDYVISEYINSSMRIYFKQAIQDGMLHEDASFKRDYQITPDYRNNFEFILKSVKEDILSRFSLINSNNIEIQLALSKPVKMKDFNDRVIVQTAIEEGTDILTDDADFLDCDENITILTKNPKILKYELF